MGKSMMISQVCFPLLVIKFSLITISTAFDRMAKMSKFNFEGYAILPETPAQSESFLRRLCSPSYLLIVDITFS